MRNKIPITKEKLRQLYLDEGLTAKAIAERFNCSESTIRRYLLKFELFKISGVAYAVKYAWAQGK